MSSREDARLPFDSERSKEADEEPFPPDEDSPEAIPDDELAPGRRSDDDDLVTHPGALDDEVFTNPETADADDEAHASGFDPDGDSEALILSEQVTGDETDDAIPDEPAEEAGSAAQANSPGRPPEISPKRVLGRSALVRPDPPIPVDDEDTFGAMPPPRRTREEEDSPEESSRAARIPLSAAVLITLLAIVFGYVAIRQLGGRGGSPATNPDTGAPADAGASAHVGAGSPPAVAAVPDRSPLARTPPSGPAETTPATEEPVARSPEATPVPARPAGASDSAPREAARPARASDSAPREAARRGQFALAARLWSESLSGRPASSSFTVKTSTNCETTNLKALFDTAPSDPDAPFLLPVTVGGRSCYRVCYGVYPDRSSAERASRSIPPARGNSAAVAQIVPLADLIQR